MHLFFDKAISPLSNCFCTVSAPAADTQGTVQGGGGRGVSITGPHHPHAPGGGSRGWRNSMGRVNKYLHQSGHHGHQSQPWGDHRVWFKDGYSKSSRQQLQQQLQPLLGQQSWLGSLRCTSHVPWSLCFCYTLLGLRGKWGPVSAAPPTLLCSLEIFVAVETTVSGQGQDWGAPVQGTQPVPRTPMPRTSCQNLCYPLTSQVSSHCKPPQGTPLSHNSVHQEKDGFVDTQNSSVLQVVKLCMVGFYRWVLFHDVNERLFI